MTFDLSKLRKHYATNKTNVSPICMPGFIHTFTIVVEKKSVFRQNPNFCTNYGPWWPLTFVKGNQYIHFWKAHITYYHCAKFHVSVISSVWEKCNVKFFWPFLTNLRSKMSLCTDALRWDSSGVGIGVHQNFNVGLFSETIHVVCGEGFPNMLSLISSRKGQRS